MASAVSAIMGPRATAFGCCRLLVAQLVQCRMGASPDTASTSNLGIQNLLSATEQASEEEHPDQNQSDAPDDGEDVRVATDMA